MTPNPTPLPAEAIVSEQTKILLDDFCAKYPDVFNKENGLGQLLDLEDMLIKLMTKREALAEQKGAEDQTQSLITEIEDMYHTLHFNGNKGKLEVRNRDMGYNQALEDVLAKLRERK